MKKNFFPSGLNIALKGKRFFSAFFSHYIIVRIFLLILLIFTLLFCCISFYFWSSTAQKITTLENTSRHNFSKKESVILVFGAATYGNSPSAVFSDRLRVAAKLYFSGYSRKILISGDNKTNDYNEPRSGKIFLEQMGVPSKDIVLDYAGFRTYDTCARAKKIFGVDQAYLVTQQFHLPRAIFLCESFGIKTRGVSTSLQTYHLHIKNKIRETLAQQQSFYEVFLFPHDPKFLGKKEFIFPRNSP